MEKIPTKKRPWNYGKRKPYTDDLGLKWCDCKEQKLIAPYSGRGQANCRLFGFPWYN